MVFWNRLRQSQLHNLFKNQFQKCHLQTCALNQPSLHTRINTLNIPRFSSLLQNNPHFNFPNNVRFFAAPIQFQKKVEEEDTGPKINEMITAPVVRLVTDEGHEIIPRRQALERAKRLELDLVEVAKNANPPVCKIMDYNKERYKQQVIVKERAKSIKANLKKGTVKEIRFAGQITLNDMKLKADTTRRLLEEGYRVKCAVKRKKKDDNLENCLSRFLSLIEDVTVVEFGPIVDGDSAHFVLRHIKLGKGKRAGKQKSKGASPSSADGTELCQASGESESGKEYEDDSESDEEDTQKIPHSHVFDAEDGASRDARSNKETLPANRYSKPTRSNKEELATPANRYSQPTRSNKEELPTPPANRYSQPTRSNKEEFPTPLANRYSQPTRSNKEELPTPLANRYSQPASRRPSTDSAAPLGTENRYRREPRNCNTPVGNNGARIEPPPITERLRQPHFGAPHSASTHEQPNPPGQANRYKKVSAGDENRRPRSGD